jgi:stage IV sporulation protein FB
MSTSYSIGSVFGIPVRVHITLLIFLPLFALSFAPVGGLIGLFYGALGAVGLFGSVVLHEVGHSLVARAKGSRILEILLLPIGGMARLNQLPRKPADEIQTALAGPAVSLILGVLGLWLTPAVYAIDPVLAFLTAELGRINLFLVLFNLIPSFPMDGGRVFRAALVPRLGRLAATQWAAKVGRGIAWVFGALALWPLLHGGPIRFSLLLIAFFVHQAAGAEARMAAMKAAETRRRTQAGGEWQIPDADVQVGPPPYAPSRPDYPAVSRGVFDDLFRKWR